jgi:hypothetical protein
MISPIGLMLLASVAFGVLVEDCNIGDFVIKYDATIVNNADVPVFVNVSGQDFAQGFSLTGNSARTIHSYVGGKLAIVAGPFDVTAGLPLVNERLFLQRQVAKGTLTVAEVQAVNARLASLATQLKDLMTLPSPSPGTSNPKSLVAYCSAQLKADAAVTVNVFVDATTNTVECR